MSQVPSKIIFWKNNTVIAFDNKGKQMPSWQGEAEEILQKLASLTPGERSLIDIEFNKVWR